MKKILYPIVFLLSSAAVVTLIITRKRRTNRYAEV